MRKYLCAWLPRQNTSKSSMIWPQWLLLPRADASLHVEDENSNIWEEHGGISKELHIDCWCNGEYNQNNGNGAEQSNETYELNGKVNWKSGRSRAGISNILSSIIPENWNEPSQKYISGDDAAENTSYLADETNQNSENNSIAVSPNWIRQNVHASQCTKWLRLTFMSGVGQFKAILLQQIILSKYRHLI